MSNSLTGIFETVKLSLFPGFENKTAAFLNLNDCAVAARRQPARSPFLDPTLADRFLTAVHRKLGVDYSLGGYLEDRRDLWRGSYLEAEQAVHAAIDINVRAGTPVSVVHPARVIRVVADPDQNGGWGTAVVFALEKPVGEISHFIYAHLSQPSIAVSPGDLVRPGTVVGRVGRYHENGGWYEHLHVQAVTAAKWAEFQGDLAKIDGYVRPTGGAAHPDFPDPMALLGPR